ncbi:glycine zipper domain-containing protein [Pseudoroseomonas globiformis]|uniref:Glycine zipper domain-containing protein n=1 Tax=Teichococcus globiformis TaxID=2307229 RepID=A0ABV7G1B7_9PROT
MIRHATLALPLLAALSLGACAPGGMDPQARSVVGGTASGAALGGIVGSFSGNAGLGALIGAGAGAGAGYLYDQSQQQNYYGRRGRGRY